MSLLRTESDPVAVQRVRIDRLYRQNAVAQSTALLNAGIYVLLARYEVGQSALAAWGGAFAVVFGARALLLLAFQRASAKSGEGFDPRVWERRFCVGVAAAGAVWGVAGSLLMPLSSTTYPAFLAFLLAGTTAGASVAYCMSFPAVQCFLLPALLPFALRLVADSSEFRRGMGALTLFYTLLMAFLTRRISAYAVDSVRLRYEQDGLLRALTESQALVANSTKMAALGEMASGVAHEINNPLGAIVGHLDMLELLDGSGKATPGSIRGNLGSIREIVRRISKIVAGLRSFSRDASRDPMTEFPLRELVEITLPLCQARYRDCGVRLEVTPPRESLRVSGRITELSQVLLNLLNNAFDAVEGRGGAIVRIEVRESKLVTELIVVDSGTGVPDEIRERIMEPFFTTKPPGVGTGLGLSISKGILERHGGELTLLPSEPGSGARFAMRLPIAGAAVGRADTSADAVGP